MYQLNPILEIVVMKDLVQDPEWQQLRASFVSTWNKNYSDNCLKLRQYLGDISNCDEKKLRIVMNYLTGTGFRTGRIKHPCIQSLRNDISKELKLRKSGG